MIAINTIIPYIAFIAIIFYFTYCDEYDECNAWSDCINEIIAAVSFIAIIAKRNGQILDDMDEGIDWISLWLQSEPQD